MKNKINDSTDNLFGIKIFILGWLMMVLAVGLSSLLGINIFSQVLSGIGAFVILINLHKMVSWFVGLLLIGCIVDEHREERLRILSEHIDLAKSYLGKKK
ncbi:TPA: hypothetical protein ACMEXA_005616 [Klebsiella variicola subsp. variicola]|uniref:hypothetical protein n=1 Tax=Klebsiella variicola TaxID=244366 RepID=UPI001CCD740D|nr:hypothetical protein [Klebsiella variicola]HBQ8857473.1 hypothetical protein [Klebsiella variicola subsp. variicola]HBQ8869314.1 hypothetical protein [Klebsiella pneumoniae]MEC5999726.1 hypothetical protein [Klebsiella variicola]UBN00601.1 hypothetical protein LB484_29500 [Klebsiella variicola]HBQ8863781.1 hypothetical protein [Klebsiella variicola subsp. variicola]